jgi:hypothetical protein
MGSHHGIGCSKFPQFEEFAHVIAISCRAIYYHYTGAIISYWIIHATIKKNQLTHEKLEIVEN